MSWFTQEHALTEQVGAVMVLAGSFVRVAQRHHMHAPRFREATRTLIASDANLMNLALRDGKLPRRLVYLKRSWQGLPTAQPFCKSYLGEHQLPRSLKVAPDSYS